jgi:hypothetical protein
MEMEPSRHKIKPTGRPVKAIKREVRACIRFTRPEYLVINEKAGKVGMKPSAYLRHLGIHTIIITRLTPEEREIARNLIGMANNLNQFIKCCHVEGVPLAAFRFHNLTTILDEMLKKLKP